LNLGVRVSTYIARLTGSLTFENFHRRQMAAPNTKSLANLSFAKIGAYRVL
jgi:hypothetical protein